MKQMIECDEVGLTHRPAVQVQGRARSINWEHEVVWKPQFKRASSYSLLAMVVVGRATLTLGFRARHHSCNEI